MWNVITSIRLDFIDVNRFAVERSLSDKISVICSRKRFRRVKDLYDTYMLISLYNINGNILTECLSHRDVNFELMPIDETVIVQLKNVLTENGVQKGRCGSETSYITLCT